VHKGTGLSAPTNRQRFNTFLDMSWKTVLEYSRYPIAFIAMFAQIFLIVFMFIFATAAFSPSGSGFSGQRQLAGVMIYGLVTNLILSFTLWEVGFSLREEQVRGTLESLYLSPADKFANLVSRIFVVLTWTGAMCVLAIVVVGLVVGGLPFENVLMAAVVLIFTTSGFLGMGFIFAGITIKLKETAQLLVNFFQFFFMIFSAQFFPFAALRSISPAIVDYVSALLPVSYCVDAFRSLLIGLPSGYPELAPLNVEIAVVVLFGLISPVVGYLIYKRAERSARRQGNLGEY